MINERIVELAKLDIGIEEIPNNMGWEDKKFQSLMEACGWRKGEAWCALWVEKIWKQAYADSPDMVILLDTLFNAGAVKTYSNFLNDETFVCDKHWEVGAIVIWQLWENGKSTWMGHAGIVSETLHGEFKTIEGNANSAGGREGIEVAEKNRLLDFTARSGLVLRGFIHPI